MVKQFLKLSLLVLLGISACCEEKVEECPCLNNELQYPVYKACAFYNNLEDAYDCSQKELLYEIYSSITYPAQAREDSIQGRVMISFEIFPNGSIGNFTSVNDTIGHGLADAAIEGIQSLGELGFCPKYVNCEAVLDTFYLPVSFKLN